MVEGRGNGEGDDTAISTAKYHRRPGRLGSNSEAWRDAPGETEVGFHHRDTSPHHHDTMMPRPVITSQQQQEEVKSGSSNELVTGPETLAQPNLICIINPWNRFFT